MCIVWFARWTYCNRFRRKSITSGHVTFIEVTYAQYLRNNILLLTHIKDFVGSTSWWTPKKVWNLFLHVFYFKLYKFRHFCAWENNKICFTAIVFAYFVVSKILKCFIKSTDDNALFSEYKIVAESILLYS